MEDDKIGQATTSSSNSATVTLPDIGGHSSVMRRDVTTSSSSGVVRCPSGDVDVVVQPVNWKGMPTTGIEKVRQPNQSRADFERKRVQRCMEQAQYDRNAEKLDPEQRANMFTEMLESNNKKEAVQTERETKINEYIDKAIDAARARWSQDNVSGNTRVNHSHLTRLQQALMIRATKLIGDAEKRMTYAGQTLTVPDLRQLLKNWLRDQGHDFYEQRAVTITGECDAMRSEDIRIREKLRVLQSQLPYQFAVGYDYLTGSYQVTPSTMGLMVDLVEQLPAAQVLEFVERVSDEDTREFALRKDIVGALQVFTGCNQFMSVKPGTDLIRLLDAFYRKHGVVHRLNLAKSLHDPLGLFVDEAVLKEVLRTMERPKGSLLDSIGVKHESIMDGPRSWKEHGVDLKQVPALPEIGAHLYRTTHTFNAAFEVEPSSFVFRGKQFTFLEPFHFMTLYYDRIVGRLTPRVDAQVVVGHVRNDSDHPH